MAETGDLPVPQESNKPEGPTIDLQTLKSGDLVQLTFVNPYLEKTEMALVRFAQYDQPRDDYMFEFVSGTMPTHNVNHLKQGSMLAIAGIEQRVYLAKGGSVFIKDKTVNPHQYEHTLFPLTSFVVRRRDDEGKYNVIASVEPPKQADS